MLRRHRYIKYLWRITITVSVVVMSLFSCKDKNDNLIAFAYDPDTVPTMITTSVSQLISDSGITRYRIVADLWMVFEQAKEPYWYFPEGIYFEQFTPDFEIEATVEADTAWYYNVKDLWRLKKNVHVENRKGEQFDSEELFWDGKNGKVFSEAYIEIKSGHTELKGYGFESNQTMTDYRIFRPHDGKLPFSEAAPADSLQPDSGEVNEAENLMPVNDN
ncbi:LPS export ABC transporter periplasmic protein LptC [Proteiniphilum saccharofermentans]|uniref:LPS export ABC transporter periplasmic protein LptC n=1 Tax=Proteiniphilum saccharofermentans TaxID=1642647 RepID=A0A1R3T912_9BACT|nr:LPS export ABC transporter periplasmic protein LptC [Proteiniphilum saccharofermentans]SCD21788.1 LPS export ABC transporter periplasmic protein LptC [Proteiniphilum saccharofermentans]